MANDVSVKDKLRNLRNYIKVQGVLMQFTTKEGTTKKGNPWIHVRGAIQFGKSAAYTQWFDTGLVSAHKTNADGTLNSEFKKSYTTIRAFATSARPASEAAYTYDTASYVEATGGFATNNYVGKDEALHESVAFKPTSLKLATRPSEDADSTSDRNPILRVEGMVLSLAPEMKNEEETGRLKMTIGTVDYFKNLVPVKGVIVAAENRDVIEDQYPVGTTALFNLDWIPRVDAAPAPTRGGFGVQYTTSGKTHLELVCVGAEPPAYEGEEKAIDPQVMRILKRQYKEAKDELEAKGYMGGKTSAQSAPTATTATSAAKKTAPIIEQDFDDDDEIPF